MDSSRATRVGAAVRAAGRACAVLAAIAATAACDNSPQKPKTSAMPFDIVPAAAAQTTDLVVPPAAISGAMQPVDEAFALFAASSGLAEVEASRLVLKTEKRSEIRGYAERMAKEHGRSVDDLRKIVAPKGLTLPAGPTGRHLDMVTKLSGVRAQDVGDAFVQRFGIDAHKEAIALFERHVIDGKDPQLRKFAEQMLAALREHMSTAQKLVNAAAAGR